MTQHLNNKVRTVAHFQKHDSLIMTYDDVYAYVSGYRNITAGLPVYLFFNHDELFTMNVWIVKELFGSKPRGTISFDCLAHLGEDSEYGIMMENMQLVPMVVRVNQGFKLGFYSRADAKAFQFAIAQDSTSSRPFLKLTELE